MNLTEIQFILANLEAREELKRLDRERFRGMTSDEVRTEKRVSRRAGYAAHQFLDIEVEESEGEVESCIAAEDGFEAPRFEGRTVCLLRWEMPREDSLK